MRIVSTAPKPSSDSLTSTSSTDLACLCGSTAFQEADLACLQRDCTADELADAIAFSAEQCGASQFNFGLIEGTFC